MHEIASLQISTHCNKYFCVKAKIFRLIFTCWFFSQIKRHYVNIYKDELMTFLFFAANKVLLNQSNESPSEHASTTKTPRYEDNIKTSPSCAQQLSKVFIAGDKCSKALQIGLPVTTIAIFIVGIVCTITIQLPGMNYGLFEFTNISNHHSS